MTEWIVVQCWRETEDLFDGSTEEVLYMQRLRVADIVAYGLLPGEMRTEVELRSAAGEFHYAAEGDITRQLDALFKPRRLEEVL